ncbi:hypothetical protein Tco_1072586 [Tanacetum coccineum]
MSNLKFAETHNLVAFLKKPKESDGFEGIIDFLNASYIRYALTIQALVDGKKVIVSEMSVRRALKLKDAKGTECLPNDIIFEQLTLMGVPGKQVEGMTKHKEIYVTPFHTKKVFANMKREGKGFSGRVTPLFQTMMVQGPEELEPITDEAANKEHAPIHSNDPLLSGLGAQEDASKQGRKIADLDADEGTAEVTTANATPTTIDELTLAQTLIEIKAAKPKAVTTVATTTTTTVTRAKARGVAKDKGKEKMVEPEKPLKKKDQILSDEEITQRLQEEWQAKLEEEERLARQKEEDANISK